jgi:hypothetical protein
MFAVFQQAMSDLTAEEGLAIRDAYDFARFQTVVDIGGARGGLSARLLPISGQSCGRGKRIQQDIPQRVG